MEKNEKATVINLNRIKGLRAEHGETQAETANVLDIHVSSYQLKEWGLVEFKPSELKALADHWEVDIKELFLH
jgi:DNA-binding XRE family transcriptional regulator